jgi:hypothetical protein
VERRLAPGTAAQLVLWSPLVLAGGFTLLLSQIFGWVFIPMSDLAGLTAFRGELVRAEGRVVAVEPTSSSVNDRRVMEVRFTHAVDGATHPGSSYSTSPGPLRPDDTVALEYPAGRPELARVAGMRGAPFPAWTALTAIVPGLTGLVLLAIALVTGARRLRLLRGAEIVPGRRVDSHPTRVRINNRRVYELTYEAHTSDGRTRRVVGRSHRPEEIAEQGDVAVDRDTGAGLLLDALPGRPRLEPDGTLAATRPRPAWLAGLLLALAAGGWLVQLAVHSS